MMLEWLIRQIEELGKKAMTTTGFTLVHPAITCRYPNNEYNAETSTR
jgi:hypothetical protein